MFEAKEKKRARAKKSSLKRLIFKMEANTLKIEKLRDAENWQQWKFIVEILMDNDELLDVCTGTMVKPEESANNYETDLALWNKANKKAKKLIVTTIESEPLRLVMNCETAREMWQKLSAVYDLKSEESLSLTQKKFFDFKWDSSASVAANVSKIEQIVKKMKSLGGEISDSMVISRILSTLPQSYTHFHSAWDSTETGRRTLANLMSRLMTEETRIEKNREDSADSSVALLSKLKVSDRSKKTEKDKALKKGCHSCGGKGHKQKDCRGCYSCGEKGHFARNCPKKSVNNDEQTKTAQAFMVDADSESTDDYWLIDTGASDHMTNREDWLTDFAVFEKPQKIRVGNGEALEAYGKGNVCVEMRVCDDWKKGIMYDVLYVPKLCGNLFSVKMAAKKGVDFSISDNGKTCTLTRNGHLVAVGLEYGELYRLDARVFFEKRTYVATKVDSLQLWHERLALRTNAMYKPF